MTVQLVRRTAKGIAGAFYEQNRSDRFRAFWPDQQQFIARNWPDFVEDARGQLASMLGRTDVAQHTKDEIYDALQEDHRRQEAYVGPQHDTHRIMLKHTEPGRVEQKVRHELESN